jgi:ATP-dependent 26S proteasome regulatory subunit
MRLRGFDLSDVDWPKIAEQAHGLSQAEIMGAAEDAARTAILDHGPEIHNSDLCAAIASRRSQPQ